MTASSRGSRAAASILRSTRRSHPLICSDCISHIRARASPTCLSVSQRPYAVAATAVKTADSAPNSSLQHLSKLKPISATAPEYIPKAGILLSRAPLLTAPQSSFEKAFYFYQKRLNERLAMPYAKYFYFKKDTPADTDRKIKERERNWAAARELGGYRAFGEEAWNDELLSVETDAAGDAAKAFGKMGIAEPKYILETLVKDAKIRAVEGKDGAAMEVKEGEEVEWEAKVEKPLSRVTESDRKRDEKKLDRQLTRTLYLLVKPEKGSWRFPQGVLEGKENLHQAAERILVQTAGVNMNTWIIGHVPIGHHVVPPTYTKTTPEKNTTPQLVRPGAKTFFMKGRIMAGQAELVENAFGLTDFKWLTKEEVKKHVSTRYWSYVQNMLADR
ncbi:54S ribosomal protein L17 mitochondrial [Cadophora gregata f. sp. sojae]|nr:54S ribosomal protein L17 mitochondrial [Cadophora gregata f. sp. sojae]